MLDEQVEASAAVGQGIMNRGAPKSSNVWVPGAALPSEEATTPAGLGCLGP